MDDYNVNNYESTENSNDETTGKSGLGSKGKVIALIVGGALAGAGAVKAAGTFVGKKAKSAKRKHSGKKAGELLDKAEQKRQEMLDALEEYDEYMKDHPELSEAEEADEEETKPEEKAEKPVRKGSRKK